MKAAERTSEWRWFGWFAITLFFLYLVMLTGCVTTRPSEYDGVPEIPQTVSDSVSLIKVTVENSRTIDAVDPTLYLVGNGRHSLGIVRGFGGKVVKWIDPSWIGPDRCFTVIAHFAGERDLVFDKTCYRSGDQIEVSLDNLFNPVSSWSHR